MRRALLLSGGTALGAVQIYTAEKLLELHGYESYKAVAGVSVGSINGVMIAQNKLDRLRKIYGDVDGTDFFMSFNFNPINLRQGIYNLNPLKKRLLKEVDIESIDNDLTYYCGVFDLQHEKYWSVSHKIFKKSSDLVQAILASSAQPVIMQGITCMVLSGLKRYCVDGGVGHVIPDLPYWRSYDAIDVILASPMNRTQVKPLDNVDDLLEIGGRFIECQIDSTIRHDLSRLKEWSKKVPVTIYAPKDSGKQFDASKETIKWRLDVVGKEMWENPIHL